MKLILSLITIAATLTACSPAEDDIFAKKEKCLEYMYIMEEKVENEFHPTQPIVFYSPSLNTCIGAYTAMTGSGIDRFLIFNLLTNEHIYNEYSAPADGMTGWDKYEAKKEELTK